MVLRMELQGASHAKPLAGCSIRAAADAALACIYVDSDAYTGAWNRRHYRDFFADSLSDIEVAAGNGSGNVVSRG